MRKTRANIRTTATAPTISVLLVLLSVVGLIAGLLIITVIVRLIAG